MEQSYLCHEAQEHEVNGKTLRFYPLSMGAISRLKTIGKPIAEALTNLLSGDLRKKDQGTIYRQWKNDSEQSEGTEMTTHPTTLELARLRTQEREGAIAKMVDVFTEEKSGLEITRIIMDSLRDDFERPTNDVAVKKVYAELDLRTLNQMIVGVLNANGNAFGPFADLIRLKLKGALAAAGASEPSSNQATGTAG